MMRMDGAVEARTWRHCLTRRFSVVLCDAEASGLNERAQVEELGR
jgi:hypothetical protein